VNLFEELHLQSVDLEEVTTQWDLQARRDHKYLVPIDVIMEIVANVDDHFASLKIDGLSTFSYSTQYFDTPDFRLYEQHFKRVRRRCKVRYRSYLDSPLRRLEVKAKTIRSQTAKWSLDGSPGLDDDGKLFVRESLNQSYGDGFHAGVEYELVPTVKMHFERSTLVSLNALDRITIDTNVSMVINDKNAQLDPAMAIVEVKTAAIRGEFTKLLLNAGYRPAALSKYAAAVDLMASHRPRAHAPGRLAKLFTVTTI